MQIQELLWKAHGDEATEANPKVFEIVAWSCVPSEALDDEPESFWTTFVQDVRVTELDDDNWRDEDVVNYTHCFLCFLDEVAIVHFLEDDSYELCACKDGALYTQVNTHGDLLECRRLFSIAVMSPWELKKYREDMYNWYFGK